MDCPICNETLKRHQGSDTRSLYCNDCGLLIRYPIKLEESIKKWLKNG